MFDYFDWEDVWQFFGLLFLVAVVTVGITAIVEPHTVTGYYLSKDAGAANVCVKVDVNWNVDDTAFCTDDANKALYFVNMANLSLKLQNNQVPVNVTLPSSDNNIVAGK